MIYDLDWQVGTVQHKHGGWSLKGSVYACRNGKRAFTFLRVHKVGEFASEATALEHLAHLRDVLGKQTTETAP